jgi:Fe-S cluster assembly protein SufD
MTAVLTDRDLRAQAAQRFEQLGWPTPRLEDWKYTNLAPLAEWCGSGRLARSAAGEPRAATQADLTNLTLAARAAAELVFVDGVFAPELSTNADAFAMSAAVRAEHYGRYADYANHAMTALNTANAQDAALLHIPRAFEGFVHVIHFGTDGVASHPRNLFVVDRGAQAAIVETFAGSGRYFTNAVTEIVAGEGAVVDHYKLECESTDAYHVATTQVHQERASSVTTRAVSIGGAVVRNEVNVALTGEGASVVLDGLFVLTGKQHVDNHTVVDHARPHCESLELYKGILDDSARGIFDGKIIVRPGAQKTVSRQTNNNLLLSETAIVDSKPTLEISNDDVKCNHGSTIGQLDEEAMFYLRSRGLGEAEARNLLVYAFASEIVDRMKLEPVRELIRRAMFRSLPGRLPERRAEGRRPRAEGKSQ